MRIAPEGWPFIALALLACLVLALFRLWLPLAFWIPLTIWVIAFFRDPARPGPRGEQLLIAPADGKVISLCQQRHPAGQNPRLRGRSCPWRRAHRRGAPEHPTTGSRKGERRQERH